MRHQPDIFWKLPLPNTFHFDFLFLAHNVVMDDACNLHAIALGGICAQNHLLVAKPLVSQRFPFDLSNGTRTWSPCSWQRWWQAMKDKGFGTTSLHHTAPLLPLHRCGWIWRIGSQVLLVERGLICLHIPPRLAIPKVDILLLDFHPCLSKITKSLFQVLYSFVVDLEQSMNSCMGHIVQLEQQQATLGCQRRCGFATAIDKKRMHMMGADVGLAAVVATAMLEGSTTWMRLKLRQVSPVKEAACLLSWAQTPEECCGEAQAETQV